MIFDLIKKRRSVFPDQYVDIPISKENLDRILEAANWAPSHKRTEPWRFKVMRGESKARLGTFLSDKYYEVEEKPKRIKVKNLKENPAKSAVVIAICMQRDSNESIPEWEEIAAVAMAVQNMWLCCTEIGIGCYWSSPSLIAYMDEFFDLAVGEKCLGFLYMGFFEGELQVGERSPVNDKVVWVD
ncbi:MAG: nitroreductase [Maribacter sp.]|nr:MAG: nitroreductase [Maribacter sp.]